MNFNGFKSCQNWTWAFHGSFEFAENEDIIYNIYIQYNILIIAINLLQY